MKRTDIGVLPRAPLTYLYDSNSSTRKLNWRSLHSSVWHQRLFKGGQGDFTVTAEQRTELLKREILKRMGQVVLITKPGNRKWIPWYEFGQLIQLRRHKKFKQEYAQLTESTAASSVNARTPHACTAQAFRFHSSRVDQATLKDYVKI